MSELLCNPVHPHRYVLGLSVKFNWQWTFTLPARQPSVCPSVALRRCWSSQTVCSRSRAFVVASGCVGVLLVLPILLDARFHHNNKSFARRQFHTQHHVSVAGGTSCRAEQASDAERNLKVMGCSRDSAALVIVSCIDPNDVNYKDMSVHHRWRP